RFLEGPYMQHADGVLALEMGDEARLAHEATNALGIAHLPPIERLQRDMLIVVAVLGRVDHTHAAAAKHALHDEALLDHLASSQRPHPAARPRSLRVPERGAPAGAVRIGRDGPGAPACPHHAGDRRAAAVTGAEVAAYVALLVGNEVPGEVS